MGLADMAMRMANLDVPWAIGVSRSALEGPGALTRIPFTSSSLP